MVTQALALLQTPVVADTSTMNWLTVFVGITAFCFLVLAIVAIGILIVALNISKQAMAQVNEIKGKAMPLIEKSQALMSELSPKINEITEKVREISVHAERIAGVAKDKVEEFSPAVSAAKETFLEANQTVRDVNMKTREQVGRVNGMVISTLDAVSHLGERIHHGIDVPTRQIAGVATGIKVAIDTFMAGARTYGRGPRPAARPRTVTPFRGMADVPPSGSVTPDRTDLGL